MFGKLHVFIKFEEEFNNAVIVFTLYIFYS